MRVSKVYGMILHVYLEDERERKKETGAKTDRQRV